MGNLRSVYQALRAAVPQAHVVVTSNPADIDAADRVVLPGQGAMPDCMKFLRESGLQAAVLKAAANKPLFGICVGEQMLCEGSEESHDGELTPGLALFPGICVKFRASDMRLDDGTRLKVPHMGWNQVEQCAPHFLWRNIPNQARFYFVHSYYVRPANPAHTAAVSSYGKPDTPPFTCAIARDNIFATQFHPEKSAENGLQLYRNFVAWQPT